MRQLVTIGHEAVLQDNICVLGNAQGHLTFHLLRHESCTAFLDYKSLNTVTIVLVSRPDNDITLGCISNPAFLAV